MSVPDELVAAAAEALRDYYGETSVSDAFQAANREAARCALQAAFAKLGECEEAMDALAAGFKGSTQSPGTLAIRAARALARELGGRE